MKRLRKVAWQEEQDDPDYQETYEQDDENEKQLAISNLDKQYPGFRNFIEQNKDFLMNNADFIDAYLESEELYRRLC